MLEKIGEKLQGFHFFLNKLLDVQKLTVAMRTHLKPHLIKKLCDDKSNDLLSELCKPDYFYNDRSVVYEGSNAENVKGCGLRRATW